MSGIGKIARGLVTNISERGSEGSGVARVLVINISEGGVVARGLVINISEGSVVARGFGI